MVRWRYSLVLALLLLLPVKTGGKIEDDEEDENLNVGGPQAPSSRDAEPTKRAEESEEEDDDDDDDDEEEPVEKNDAAAAGRRAPGVIPTAARAAMVTASAAPPAEVPRADKRRYLECYVCAYKSETPMRSCLDPSKFRVHTLTCLNPEDKCFTSIVASKQGTYETVVRGCRSNCLGTPDTTCCDTIRCNNQALMMPTPSPKALVEANKADKSIQPTVLFFVTILLVVQTVVRVAIV